jgi:hypothetical protein
MNKKVLATICAGLLAIAVAAGAQVVVRLGPPPPHPVEVVPVLPHPGWVWEPGYYRWDGVHYIWVPGVYVAPPYANARWIPGRWAPRPGGYVWIEGHWRH